MSAVSFLAAASDKTGTPTVDMNTILGVTGTLASQDSGSALHFASATLASHMIAQSGYAGLAVTVLVKQDNVSYLPSTVIVYDAVVNSANYASTSGVDGFGQPADGARAVTEYVHDNSVSGNEWGK